MKYKLPRNLFLILVLGFLYLPIFTLILFSFNKSRNQYVFSGFTLDWYKSIPDNQALMDAITTTLIIAILSTIIAVFIGFISSIGLMFLNNRFKRFWLSVNNIPMINPDIVTGVSLMMFLIFAKVTLGFQSILIAHIAFSVPFVILSVLPTLNSFGSDMIKAGLDLGLRPAKIIPKVILPICTPGLITGALISFTMSIDDFVISYFVTGNGVNNLSIWIFSQTKKGVNPTANAVSTIMFIIILILLVVYYSRQTKDKGELMR